MKQKKIIDLIIKSEKGVNRNEPESVGGLSVDGVTRVTYKEFLPKILLTIPDAPSNVEELTGRPDVVQEFYRLYLARFHVWELPVFLQYIYADFVVNAGAAAVKIIQRMAGTDADGVWGSGTSHAVSAWRAETETQLESDPSVDNKLISRFHEEKIAHYQRLVDQNPDKFAQWLDGWIRRSNHVFSELHEFFEVAEPTPSAMDAADITSDKLRVPVAEEGLQELERVKGTLAEIQGRLELLEKDVPTLKAAYELLTKQ